MIQADCAFRMGRSHLVCQDYAAAGAGEISCVLLADGCSSSPDTDIGARLLVRSAMSRMACLLDCFVDADSVPDAKQDVEDRFQVALERYHQDAIALARQHGDALGLPDTALDATLLTVAAQGDSWFASTFGDGVIVAKNRDGSLAVTAVSYPGGYPFYPNYLLDADRKRALLQQENSGRKVERFTLAPDGETEEVSCRTCAADAPCHVVVGKVEEVEWVAALSDGVHSFSASEDAAGQGSASRANLPVPLPVVLRELLAFKTTRGQFVQRRLQRFLRDCDRHGWQHYDDVSLAALSL